MGLDIFSNTGVLVTVEQLTHIVNNHNRGSVSRFLINLTAKILQHIQLGWSFDLLEDKSSTDLRYYTAVLVRAFRDLSIESNLDVLRSMLKDMTPVTQISTGEYCIEKESEKDAAIVIWGLIIEKLYPHVPKPIDLVIVSSPRCQDLALPKGQVLIVFSDMDCFEHIKTDAGRRLDLMLGIETQLTNWTTYSV